MPNLPITRERFEKLEKENAALQAEITKLRIELEQYSVYWRSVYWDTHASS